MKLLSDEKFDSFKLFIIASGLIPKDSMSDIKFWLSGNYLNVSIIVSINPKNLIMKLIHFTVNFMYYFDYFKYVFL